MNYSHSDIIRKIIRRYFQIKSSHFDLRLQFIDFSLSYLPNSYLPNF